MHLSHDSTALSPMAATQHHTPWFTRERRIYVVWTQCVSRPRVDISRTWCTCTQAKNSRYWAIIYRSTLVWAVPGTSLLAEGGPRDSSIPGYWLFTYVPLKPLTMQRRPIETCLILSRHVRMRRERTNTAAFRTLLYNHTFCSHIFDYFLRQSTTDQSIAFEIWPKTNLPWVTTININIVNVCLASRVK